MKKAVVVSTGEIVTLANYDQDDIKECYEILEDNHRVIKTSDLNIIPDVWLFIETHLPGYSSDERVASSDDIQCCLDGEADDEKLARVVEQFGKTPEEWQCAQIQIDKELFEEAVENMVKLFK